jgi:hypothetical protein
MLNCKKKKSIWNSDTLQIQIGLVYLSEHEYKDWGQVSKSKDIMKDCDRHETCHKCQYILRYSIVQFIRVTRYGWFFCVCVCQG